MNEKCECGELLNWADAGECGHCEKIKCVDCFTMDEDGEICDNCAKKHLEGND